jgi:hypothetical protein
LCESLCSDRTLPKSLLPNQLPPWSSQNVGSLPEEAVDEAKEAASSPSRRDAFGRFSPDSRTKPASSSSQALGSATWWISGRGANRILDVRLERSTDSEEERREKVLLRGVEMLEEVSLAEGV